MSAEQRGPAICNDSNIGEGKDEMTKASIDLQDLRRRIYVKAKAEPSWRFWGLGVRSGAMRRTRPSVRTRRLARERLRRTWQRQTCRFTTLPGERACHV